MPLTPKYFNVPHSIQLSKPRISAPLITYGSEREENPDLRNVDSLELKARRDPSPTSPTSAKSAKTPTQQSPGEMSSKGSFRSRLSTNTTFDESLSVLKSRQRRQDRDVFFSEIRDFRKDIQNQFLEACMKGEWKLMRVLSCSKKTQNERLFYFNWTFESGFELKF